jgi:hypothetical protein
MIDIAIGLLWLLLGVVIICGVIYFVLYVLKQVMAISIPPRVEQAIWLCVLILVMIGLLSLIAGGSGAVHFPHIVR